MRTLIFSFITRHNPPDPSIPRSANNQDEILLYRPQFDSPFTFSILHTYEHPTPSSSAKDKDKKVTLPVKEEPTIEELSFLSVEANTGLEVGEELRPVRKSKRLKVDDKDTFLEAFLYVLAVSSDSLPDLSNNLPAAERD